jgi:hypothetical protein
MLDTQPDFQDKVEGIGLSPSSFPIEGIRSDWNVKGKPHLETSAKHKSFDATLGNPKIARNIFDKNGVRGKIQKTNGWPLHILPHSCRICYAQFWDYRAWHQTTYVLQRFRDVACPLHSSRIEYPRLEKNLETTQCPQLCLESLAVCPTFIPHSQSNCNGEA